MDVDLDTLCIAVYCTTDDLLPDKPANARRELSDAEVVTLCVAQAIMGIPSDRRFLAAARCQIGHLFPLLPSQSGYHKRRCGLRDTIEWLIGVFAAQSPGSGDDLLLMDSTPVECGRSVDTSRRSALSDACGYGYCASHSRRFWGMRLHWLSAPDGTPRAAILGAADRPEREVALSLIPQAIRGGETIICDKGYAGREFEEAVRDLGATIVRPPRKGEPALPFRLTTIRQRVESIFFTLKVILTLERHRARMLGNLRVRIASRLLALAACISLNHQLGRPSRSLVAYAA